MKRLKRIGILTSGGDCGGLNAVIKGAARAAASMTCEAVAITNGYAGLYNLVDTDRVTVLSLDRVDLIDATRAGSETGHSRVKIKKIDDPDKYRRIKRGLKKFKIDALVISGGDDSGSVMVDLDRNGVPCIHAPKTMDLDLQTYSVGGDSAVNKLAGFLADLRTTGRSHNRVMVVEAFGRYAGHTAFRGGVAGEADCILIPEIPVDFDVVYRHMKERFVSRILRSDVFGGTYSIVVSEGLEDAGGTHITDETAGTDAFGHKKLAGAGRYVRQQLEARLKKDRSIRSFMVKAKMFVPGVSEVPEVREVTPGHLVRSGVSTAVDVNFGMEAGAAAVVLLASGLSGQTIVGVDGNTIQYQPTEKVIRQRHVDTRLVTLYESLGYCFGREPVPFEPILREKKGRPVRPL